MTDSRLLEEVGNLAERVGVIHELPLPSPPRYRSQTLQLKLDLTPFPPKK